MIFKKSERNEELEKELCHPQTPTLERRNPGESLRLTYALIPCDSAYGNVTKPQLNQQY